MRGEPKGYKNIRGDGNYATVMVFFGSGRVSGLGWQRFFYNFLWDGCQGKIQGPADHLRAGGFSSGLLLLDSRAAEGALKS